MRRILTGALIGSLFLGLLPAAASAGDHHAVRNRWLGVGIGAGSVVLGGLLLNAIRGGDVVAAPPAVMAPPAVVYSAPPVVYAPPPVVYAPPPVVRYQTWIPGHYEERWVPLAERQQVWVEGHYRDGWWVPGHWEEGIRLSGYWTRVWVEGYWR